MLPRRVIHGAIFALSAFIAGQPLAAQSKPDLPDPATIILPDISPISDPQLRDDGLKFFYFYKPGISFAAAHADLMDCYRYLAGGEAVTLPGFVPWVEEGRHRTIERTPQYGVVGAIIGELVAGPLERSRRNTIMRRCMEPRGYARYPLRRDSWHAIVDGDVAQALLKQARLAPGPAPADQALSE